MSGQALYCSIAEGSLGGFVEKFNLLCCLESASIWNTQMKTDTTCPGNKEAFAAHVAS